MVCWVGVVYFMHWIHMNPSIIKDGDMIYIRFMYNVYLNAWNGQLCMYIYVYIDMCLYIYIVELWWIMHSLYVHTSTCSVTPRNSKGHGATLTGAHVARCGKSFWSWCIPFANMLVNCIYSDYTSKCVLVLCMGSSCGPHSMYILYM